MKKNKKFFAVFCCGFLSLVIALTGLLSFKMGKIRPNNFIASADEVISENVFYGSDLLYNISVSSSDGPGSYDGMSHSSGYVIPNFTISRSSFTIDYFSSIDYTSWDFTLSRYYSHKVYSFDFVFDTSIELSLLTIDRTPTFAARYLHLYYYVQSDFNADVYKVRIYSDSAATPYIWTHVVYYDKEDRTCDFAFLSYFEVPNDILLNDRIYYLDSSLSDNQLYNSGVQEGIRRGRDEAYQPAYDEGYDAGKLIGDSEGYRRGVADANEYSFLSLMTSIADAPVQTLRGIFDFNILGFNMYQFVCSILTICVVVFVIKLFV